MCGLWRGTLACLPTCSCREGARLALLDKREDAGEMEKPDEGVLRSNGAEFGTGEMLKRIPVRSPNHDGWFVVLMDETC